MWVDADSCWHFEDQVRICEEDSRTRHCQSLTSGGIFDTWSESRLFQTCRRSGKLWQPAGSTWRSFGSISSSRYLPEVVPGTFTLPR